MFSYLDRAIASKKFEGGNHFSNTSNITFNFFIMVKFGTLLECCLHVNIHCCRLIFWLAKKSKSVTVNRKTNVYQQVVDVSTSDSEDEDADGHDTVSEV